MNKSQLKLRKLLFKGAILTSLAVSLSACVSSLNSGLKPVVTNNNNFQSPTFINGNGTSYTNQIPNINSNNLTPIDKKQFNLINNPDTTNQDLLQLLPQVTNNFVKNQLVLTLSNNFANNHDYNNAVNYFNMYQPSQDALQTAFFNLVATKIGLITNNSNLITESSRLNPTALTISNTLKQAQLDFIASYKNGDINGGLDNINQVYNTLTPSDQHALVDSTLKQLTSLSPVKLQSLANNAIKTNNINNAGWYILAQIVIANRSDPNYNLQSHWNSWLHDYAGQNHPAALTTPTVFSQFSSQNNSFAKNVGVLLPLSNRNLSYLTGAIKSGINQANLDNGNKSVISYYDTSSAGGVDQALADAKQQNNGLIIGPLLRNNVLSASSQYISTPQLMLNQISVANTNACYVSLMPEDEATTAAQALSAMGVKNPIIFTDNSSNSARGFYAFNTAWLQLKGFTASVVTYNQNNLNTLVLTLTKNLKKYDAVFFLGRADAFLAFEQDLNYIIPGNNLVTFATSSSNAAFMTKARLNDFGNVYFTDSSLVGYYNSPKAQQAIKTIGNLKYDLRRLYAFGYDAFNIAQNYNQLRNNPNYKYNGLNGSFYKVGSKGCLLNNAMFIYHVVNGQLLQVN